LATPPDELPANPGRVVRHDVGAAEGRRQQSALARAR